MKICVAQTRPSTGNILVNIENHKKLITLAVSYKADIIIFPELSLTGYEPALAKDLATDQHDERFDSLQKMSNEAQITIGVGVPTKNNEGISISMILFQPHKAREIYSKKFIHADEEKFFIPGKNEINLTDDAANIAIAICYEISVPEHSENAFKSGAKIYIASVAKTPGEVNKAVNTLSGIAKQYKMTVLMSNAVGQAEDYECGGKTSIWNNKGILMAQLNDTGEGLLIIDTNTQEVIEKYI